ncbi:DUF721 domain-containing protein [Crenobacter sp. SG2305]|uniref:DUF721 domain-containing protein n=1 Tax=Crenobacter oryzisoli TaxID=3056844 RepID=UPI0025AB4B2C|nr:DUF721 domain-containing protein [Crenobacter sp. SG2305]MDN0083087.1 DUF721 domain-containing protein [Crenobacter sp. SG2305]
MRDSRTPADIVRKDNQLSRLTEQARALMALDRQFKKLVPANLAGYCRAVRIRDGELVLFADTSAVAARLRLMAPGWLPALAKAGYVARTVRVRVVLPSLTPQRYNRLTVGATGIEALETAAETVSDPGLAAALRRFARHRRRDGEAS